MATRLSTDDTDPRMMAKMRRAKKLQQVEELEVKAAEATLALGDAIRVHHHALVIRVESQDRLETALMELRAMTVAIPQDLDLMLTRVSES